MRFLALLLVVWFGMASVSTELHAVEIDEPEVTDVDRKHWAYVPVVRPRVPEVKLTD